MRIRSRLLLLASALLVPALIGAAIGLAYLYREEQDFNYTSMQETARALALALDREMARREAVLRTLGAAPELQAGDLQGFYAYAAAVAKQHDVAILLSDLQGEQLVNTRLPFGSSLPRMLPQERATRARLGNEVTVVSELYLPPAGLGPHSFAVQVPVRRSGEVRYFLTMASYARQVQNLLGEQRLPPGWHATVVDPLGRVAARSLEPERFVGTQVRSELWTKMSTSAEGFHEGMNLGGAPSTAFFSRAPGSGWMFLVAVPHAVLHAPARRATVFLATISLVLLGLGLLAALAVARRISHPVEALREAAHRLGQNEPVPAQLTGTVELDEVSGAMAQASARLRGATAELERRVAEAIGSYEQSQRALLQSQKLDALGRLTGGIAHDFNNVLQTLTAALQALKLRAAGEEHELLERCQRAVARGSDLARQLMAFGRVQEVRTETVDPAVRLREAQPLLAGALPANIRLTYDLACGLWPVSVDPAQLELALLNVVINARDAMPQGGEITVRGRNETVPEGRDGLAGGDYVVLSVADNGRGMSDEVMARAVDPFFTTKDVGKGAGLGLPQAYGFARQNGGTLTLQSRPALGTTVTLYVPRSRQPLAPRRPEEPAAGAAGEGRVLLVEDDEQVRATVSSALRSAGFEVHTAGSADEALSRLEAGERFDVVLTDIVMPGKLSGVDLARHIRARQPGTGVVLATGYTDRAIELPGVRALAKPYDLRQAVEALNAARASCR